VKKWFINMATSDTKPVPDTSDGRKTHIFAQALYLSTDKMFPLVPVIFLVLHAHGIISIYSIGCLLIFTPSCVLVYNGVYSFRLD
jgi:hypothetical protein